MGMNSERPGPGSDVAIVGLGYVGLPTALAFHAAGCRVLGIDISKMRLEKIAAQRVDLLESDRKRLQAALLDDAFVLTQDPSRVAEAKAALICAPTPLDRHLLPDLASLQRACDSVVRHAVPGQVLILTSTGYVGSTRDLLAGPLAVRGLRAGQEVSVAFSPERVDPGNDQNALEDVPRVVGGITRQCTAAAVNVLGRYARSLHEVSSANAAELSKLLENTFRAVNIALANEIAEISRSLGLDVMEVIGAAATKPYGFMPFFPGPGVGGHCIPCDPHYLLWQLRRQRFHAPVISQAMAAIAARPMRVVERAREVLSESGKGLPGTHVLIVGVSYKPDVEDIRESPALEIIESLLAAGVIVSYHDPLVPRVTLDDGRVLDSTAPDAVDADIVIMHTLHRFLDLSWLSEGQLVLDATYRLGNRANRVPL